MTYGGGNGSLFQFTVLPNSFAGQQPLFNGVYHLSIPGSTPFGYYSFLSDPFFNLPSRLGLRVRPQSPGRKRGRVSLRLRQQRVFLHLAFPFPCFYDFNRKALLYYFPDPDNPGRYNTDGVRYFYNFSTGQVITK